jgi:YHS domain-containing protein
MFKSIVFITLINVLVLSTLSAQDTQKQNNLSTSGLAIEGYDPVAYFTGKAVEGRKELSTSDGGVTYYFSSAQNRDLFRANPEKYKPQYGGWCAYAMGANGEKVEIDPETFKVLNGKLYLFYNKYFNNTLKTWNKDEVSLKKKADANWTKFSK